MDLYRIQNMSDSKPSLSQIVDMASKMQSRIDSLQNNEAEIKASGQSSDGQVTAIANGKIRIESIQIAPAATTNPSYESIIEACNHALHAVELKLREELLSLSSESCDNDE